MRLKLIFACVSLWYVPLSHALTLNGFTDFASTMEINARVSGIVKSISVKPGQRVKKGEELLQVDIEPYQARLDRAMAIEKSLLPAVQTFQLELERAEELYDRDSLSQVSLKNAENELAEAEGQYQAAKADSVIAAYQLKNTTVFSPINGRVLQLHTNIAQFINPAVSLSPLLTVVSSQQMKAIGLLKSEQWSDTLMHKKATVKFADKEYSGQVSFIGYGRVKQSNGIAAYEIHVSFETDHLIPAEMPVTINIKD